MMILGLALALLAPPQDLSPALQKKIAAAKAAVEKAPEDAKANLELGKLLCFDAGDFAAGLPHLAKGADETFAPVAVKDLAGGNHLERVEVGDLWFTLSKKQKPIAARCTDRALACYGEAWPKLDETWRAKMRERLATIQRKGPESKVLGPYPTNGWFNTGAKVNSGLDQELARTGKFSMKLLAPADPAPTAVASFRTDTFPCSAGQKYTFSGWVLTELTESGGDGLSIAFLDAQDKFAGVFATKALQDLPFWTQLSTEGVVPERAVKVRVGMVRSSRQGRMFGDDLSFKLDGKELLTNGSFELR
jgi:hypothetical protein